MRVIKKIHLLVLRSFATLFVPSLLVIVFVLILQFIWVYADDWIGKGMSFSIFMEMMYYIALAQIPLAMPLAVMLASIISFGAMGENFELTAIKSAGISLFRTMTPIFILAVILTGVSFFFANNIFPYALQKQYALVVGSRQMNPALKVQEGLFSYQVDGYVIRVGRKSTTGNMMYDFMIYDHTNYKNNKFVTVADSGIIELTQSLQYMLITLYDGKQYEEVDGDQFVQSGDTHANALAYHKDSFKKQEVIIPLSGFTFEEENASLFSNNYKVLNVSQLSYAIDSLKVKNVVELNRFFKNVSQNDILSNQIKMRTHIDSVNYADFLADIYSRPVSALRSIYDVDSAYEAADLEIKRVIMEDAVGRINSIDAHISSYQSVVESNKAWIVDHQIALNKKIVLAVACFIFFLIGAPLGAIIRKGGIGLPTIISIILFLLFYILLTMGERFAGEQIVSAFVGMWLPIFVFFPLDLYLFYKATNDSVILNYDYYIDTFDKAFKKVKKFIKKKKNRQGTH